MRRLRALATSAGVATLLLAASTTAPAIAAPNHRGPHRPPRIRETVVARGLDSPKHLAFGPGGLYLTESGTGGPVDDRCVDAIGPAGTPSTFCAGATASVSVLGRHGVRTVVDGLASVIDANSGETLGPAAVTFVRGRLAILFQNELLPPTGVTQAPSPAAEVFGKLTVVHRGRHGSTSLDPIADVSAWAAANPQGPESVGAMAQPPWDSDPYDVVPYRGGFAIADAAANALLWLHDGQLTLLARFPARDGAQAVPTSLAVGRDGALYVGTLRGVPSLPGTAVVYRVVPGEAPTIVVDGLSAVTDIAFDSHGRLLILEYNQGGLLGPTGPQGALLRATLGHDGAAATVEPISLTTPLTNPTGLAVEPGRHGAVYLANNGTSPGTADPSGQIVKVTGLD